MINEFVAIERIATVAIDTSHQVRPTACDDINEAYIK